MVNTLVRSAPAPIAGQTPEAEGLCLHPRGLEAPGASIDEMLGTLAHELRSPLITILNAMQVIMCTYDVDPVARRAFAVMDRQVQQAMRIIDDLFDLCAGGAGKLFLRKEVVVLGEIVAAATETAGHLEAIKK